MFALPNVTTNPALITIDVSLSSSIYFLSKVNQNICGLFMVAWNLGSPAVLVLSVISDNI
jgi:hypothetical protein